MYIYKIEVNSPNIITYTKYFIFIGCKIILQNILIRSTHLMRSVPVIINSNGKTTCLSEMKNPIY